MADYAEQDLPHIHLEKKCKQEVEEMSRLIDQIKLWQQNRQQQQSIVSYSVFTCEDDLKRAQAYLLEINNYIATLWQNVADVSPRVHQTFTNTLKWLSTQRALLEEEIVKWKYERRVYLMGGPAENLNEGLANLKTWFQTLECLGITLQEQIDCYLKIVDELSKTDASTCHQRDQFLAKCQRMVDDCNARKKEVKWFNAMLVQRGMIIYEEPPSVIRRSGNPSVSRSQKHSRIPFNMEIRFLAGEKSGLLRGNLDMEALLISEQQAREIVEGKVNPVQEKLTTVGDIGHPICTIQVPSAATEGYMSAKFIGARVQKVEKAAEDDASRVMYHMLFRIKMKRLANGATTYYPFWAISLPFSVVINANRQERYKRALMFWQLAFAIDDKSSLSVQFDEKNDKVSRIPWPNFFTALNLWFKNWPYESDKAPRLYRGLEEDEVYLQEKIGLKQTADYIGNVVTWDMFYRRRSESTGLTFWEWIFGTVESVSKSPHYWESGLVLGFTSRFRVEQILRQATQPSMVLKFSDSRPGKMVASYVNWNGTSPGTRTVEHVIFDENDDPVFAGRTLIECIRMSSKLQCVRTILPANKPIEEFYSLEHSPEVKNGQKNARSDGYVKPGVVFVWGEPPTPPVYQSDVRSPEPSSDSGMSSPASSASVFENNPSFVAWLNTPTQFVDDSQSAQDGQLHNNYSCDSFSNDQFNRMNLGGSATSPDLTTPAQEQAPAFPPNDPMADLMTDFENPNFNMAEYIIFDKDS